MPGTIGLHIDATDRPGGLPRDRDGAVAAGTRSDPPAAQLASGHHGPRGRWTSWPTSPSANGKVLTWTRDPLEPNAFHIALPAGTSEVVARSSTPRRFSPAKAASPSRGDAEPPVGPMSLYPAGHYVRQIKIRRR
jgi:hypothetical protein